MNTKVRGRPVGSGVDFGRRDQMVKMRESGMTLQAIGQTFDPPITREAVRQQLAKAAKYPLDGRRNEA